jgi:hypothetical protein
MTSLATDFTSFVRHKDGLAAIDLAVEPCHGEHKLADHRGIGPEMTDQAGALVEAAETLQQPVGLMCRLEQDLKLLRAYAVAHRRQQGRIAQDQHAAHIDVPTLPHILQAFASLGGQLGTVIGGVEHLGKEVDLVARGVEAQALGVAQVSHALTSLSEGAARTASAASRFIETSEELERRADGFVKEVGAFRLPAST